MPPRLLCPDVTTAPLDHEALPVDEVVKGSPTAAVRTLDVLAACEIGVWEMTAGTARDTEVDEVFVVVSGRGTVTFEDGEQLDLAPGVVVRLRAGERTEWTITETLRKVWIA